MHGEIFRDNIDDTTMLQKNQSKTIELSIIPQTIESTAGSGAGNQVHGQLLSAQKGQLETVAEVNINCKESTINVLHV